MSMIGKLRSIAATLSERIRREPALIRRVTESAAPLPDDLLEALPPEVSSLLIRRAAELAALPALDPADLGPELSLEKAWHGVHFLVAGDAWETRASEPATLCILGGEAYGDDPGYGPARMHGPGAVAAIAAALPEGATLRARCDPARLAAAEIYPGGWEHLTADQLWPGACEAYEEVRDFYRRAAARGHAVVIWLS